MGNFKQPLGRDPEDIRDEQVVNEATQKALAAMQTRSGGTNGSLASGVAPQGAGLFDSEGSSLLGKLGFALGFSGFGGPDWLFPPNEEIEVPARMFWELK